MGKIIHILILCLIGIASYGQSSKMLRAADFKNQQIDEQWVYVKYKAGFEPNQNNAIPLIDLKGEEQSSVVIKLKVPKGKKAIDFCNELRRTSANIVYADPIVKYIPLSIPSDVLITDQYYLSIIKAFDAWNITQGDDDITIGIIDSGIDLDHEDITTNLWINIDDPVDGVDNDLNGFVDDYYGYDFADLDTDPSIQNGNHGMIVAGIAGATTNNEKGIAGVGYNTKVAALKGFKSSNGLSGGLYDAIIYAAENGFDVVNLSWGRMGVPLQSEQDIINYAALDHDMVLVAAAGNEGGKATEQNKWYPASYDNVLSVGATDASDNKSSGSTFNHSVDLVAPGVSMFSTFNNNGYSNGGPGTSYSSPQVAAAAALVIDQYPDLSAIQVMERVRVTADDIYDIGNNSTYDGKLGKGRLNVLRAVSESNIKSLRAENPTLSSRFGSNVFFGDTVKVEATLTNHLSSVNNPSVNISSPNNDFEVSVGSFEPGFMNTQDTKNISFDVILDDNIAPNTDIEIRLDYNATGYSDFQFFEVTTSPDYADFGNENVTMTISGDGNLGFDTYSPFEGSGFRSGLDTLMKYAGILLATHSSEVSDNIVSNYSSNDRNQDFSVKKYYKLSHHPGADYFGYSEFDDLNRSVFIEQSNIAWENEDYLILRYRIVNNSAAAINNLSFGVFADWDLDDATANYAEYDLTGDYLFTRNEAANIFAGIKVTGGDSEVYSALDIGTYNGNSQDVNESFIDTDKYDFLVNQAIVSAGNFGVGNDVASLSGVTINQLDAYSEEFVNVIYAISDTQSSLESTFTNASVKLDEFLLKPRVLETYSVCAGSSLTIDPSEGSSYEFYEDALAQILITTGTSFTPGVITKDTVFYVKNIDELYPSDIFEVRVKLFNEIADFELSTDTLYLDNPTTNVVQFTDKSLNATSWNWDFDQGTSSTIQNPSLSFSSAGTYAITLQVSNDLGCIDSETKDLVVATRPSPPTLSNVVICPGQDVTLPESSAEKLHVYSFQNSTSPAVSGANITLSSIHQDTTVYVSGVYGSFESDKVALDIDVLEVAGSIYHRPDTTSESHRIVFEAMGVDNDATLAWTVDGGAAGSTNQIFVDASSGIINTTLEVTSVDACTINLEKETLISTSPFASQSDLTACNSEEVDIRPSNGSYFGFYEDPELTTLIKKGTHLRTNSYNQLYVVSLDDGLPGMPIEVNITNELLEFDIISNSEDIGQKHKVSLSVSFTNEVDTYEWYINGELTETSENPIFFLDDELYEISVDITTISGCSNSASLVLDFTPPLALEDPGIFSIYPNPSNGDVTLNSKGMIEEIALFSLDGKELSRLTNPKDRVSFSKHSQGLYIVKATIDGQSFETYLLIR